jgi:hypothetical protein
MGTTVRLLFIAGMVGLFAGPAQAHTIGIRDGSGSTFVCDGSGDALAAWEPLDPDGEFENNCLVSIFSIDFQLGAGAFPSEPIVPTHPPGSVESSDSSLNLFDTLQLVSTEFGPAYRFFSSEGNIIASCANVTCTPVIDFTAFVQSSPFFSFFVEEEGSDAAGWVRIVDYNQTPVPEPATLLLLGAGLGGMALKRRRR